MAKGAVAKDNLIKRFIAAAGKDYVGVDDTGKKYHFWSSENGERMQIAVTLTAVKNPLPDSGGDLNFEDEPQADGMVVAPKKVKAMDADEAATLSRLMEELGL